MNLTETVLLIVFIALYALIVASAILNAKDRILMVIRAMKAQPTTIELWLNHLPKSLQSVGRMLWIVIESVITAYVIGGCSGLFVLIDSFKWFSLDQTFYGSTLVLAVIYYLIVVRVHQRLSLRE